MSDKLEKLIKKVYQGWKSSHTPTPQAHPDEEMLACLLEDKLSQEEGEQVKTHLLTCERCAENFATLIKLQDIKMSEVPADLVAQVKNLIVQQEKVPFLEIILKLKENILELVNTTGDVLVGQELVPAPVLRSRQIKDFKDEITILKDLQDIHAEIKIESKSGQYFDVTVTAKEKQTSKAIKDVRITLLKDEVELESYLADSGRVTFEHVLLGKYTIELSSIEAKLASVLLEIKT